jgi:hypothetical protein
MKFPLIIKFPTVFGWTYLQFSDRLKLMAFLVQTGAGVVMTFMAYSALKALVKLNAIWPIFYIATLALILIGVIVTGFAGLLISRTLKVQGPGGFLFESQDASSAAVALKGVTDTASALPAQTIAQDGSLLASPPATGIPVVTTTTTTAVDTGITDDDTKNNG